MKLCIEIRCDGAAFEHDLCHREVMRILNKGAIEVPILRVLEDPDQVHVLRDINGNRVGCIYVVDADEADGEEGC